MAYKISKNIKTQIKMTKNLFLKDVIILVVALFFFNATKGIVHASFSFFYIVTGMLIVLGLILPSISNKKKRNFHSLYFALVRNKNTYISIDKQKEENKFLREETINESN